MKQGKKKVQPKMHQRDLNLNDEFAKKPVKKGTVKRDRKLSIYDRVDDDEENLEFDLYGYEEEETGEDDSEF
ncbi:hypothetical protein MASR2M12_03870 [Bacteroidales bacterium]